MDDIAASFHVHNKSMAGYFPSKADEADYNIVWVPQRWGDVIITPPKVWHGTIVIGLNIASASNFFLDCPTLQASQWETCKNDFQHIMATMDHHATQYFQTSRLDTIKGVEQIMHANQMVTKASKDIPIIYVPTSILNSNLPPIKQDDSGMDLGVVVTTPIPKGTILTITPCNTPPYPWPRVVSPNWTYYNCVYVYENTMNITSPSPITTQSSQSYKILVDLLPGEELFCLTLPKESYSFEVILWPKLMANGEECKAMAQAQKRKPSSSLEGTRKSQRVGDKTKGEKSKEKPPIFSPPCQVSPP
jgi:hypothetical protein